MTSEMYASRFFVQIIIVNWSFVVSTFRGLCRANMIFCNSPKKVKINTLAVK